MVQSSLSLLVVVAIALVSGHDAADTKMTCYSCQNLCWEADQGIAKEVSSKLNKTCVSDCLNVPFQTHEKALNAEQCTGEKESCFTVHAIMRYQVKADRSMFTLRYLRRGCVKECPSQVCDFANISKCNLPPQFGAYLQKTVDSERQKIVKSIHDSFDGEDRLTELGKGGEMKCCESSGCNSDRESEVAHTYLKDEL